MKHFSWDKYLEETNSLPAPARAFKVVREFALYSVLLWVLMMLFIDIEETKLVSKLTSE